MTTFRLLGPVEAEIDGRTVPLGAPKQRCRCAFLLLHANEVVSPERAIDFLWGEDPPPSAHGSLQVYVHGLRKQLGNGRIETRGSGYQLMLGWGSSTSIASTDSCRTVVRPSRRERRTSRRSG